MAHWADCERTVGNELARALGLDAGDDNARRDTEKVLRARRDIEILRLLPIEVTDDDMDSVLKRLDQALS